MRLRSLVIRQSLWMDIEPSGGGLERYGALLHEIKTVREPWGTLRDVVNEGCRRLDDRER